MSMKRIFENRGLLLGILIIMVYAVIAIGAPLIAPPEGENPYDLPRDGLAGNPEPPSLKHPFGMLQDRLDIFYGIIWGTRVAFRVGLIITLGRVLIGLPLGVIAGYYGGKLDAFIMRVTDAFLAFPIVAGVMLLMTVQFDYIEIRLGEGDIAIIVGLILFGWIQYARVIRGNVMVEKSKEYVNAAVSIGAGERCIMLKHILPNSTQGILVLIASDIGTMVMTVAALTFIGLTGDQPIADWGMILKISRHWIVSGQSNAFAYWYTYVFAILAIIFFSIGWNLIGDGLRDILDPKMRSIK